MCGICGFSGVGDQGTLADMMAAMPYRGPDGQGRWDDGRGLYLGHLRLAIIDIDGGQQPLATADQSLVVVFNGEIYNHGILRKELEARGHIFRTDHSDTEVLLHGYREWGTALTGKMNGMWAFALFDRNMQTLWLSRDRFGKKPLYYTQVGETFIFSSELSSLVQHPQIHPKVDQLSLKKYFAHGYVPAPRTAVNGVNKLPAGHDLFFNLRDRTAKLERYWRLKLVPDNKLVDQQEALAHVLVDKLYAAVDCRLRADVPVGVFLSGGIDSSGVTALALSASKGGRVRTFSIGFEDASFNELPFSNEVAEILGTQHVTEILTASRCLQILDQIYGRLDEPMADSSLVPSFLMCQLAREQVTVALGGDGSDELFAGYDPFMALSPARKYSRMVPSLMHKGLTKLVGSTPVSHRNMSFDFKLKKFFMGLGFDAEVRNPIWLGCLPPSHLGKLFCEHINVKEVYSEAISAWQFADSDNDIDRTLQFYSELYLQNGILTKMDRAGMLNSLEVRSPFLDIDFVDLIRTIPAQLKFSGKETKNILKESLKPVLPPEILYRSKKGFGMPIAKWFYEKTLEIDPKRFNGLFDAGFVETLSKEHVNGRANWGAFLWAHYVLERWADRPVFSKMIS